MPDFADESVGQEEVSGVFKKYLRELPAPLLMDDTPEGHLQNQFAQVLQRIFSLI